MAHLMAPKPPRPELPVFFNVDGVVGAPPANNLREDVLLVQFAFKIIADQPLATTGTGEYLAIMRAVKVTGTIDAATINAIRAQQQDYAKTRPGKVVDGRVSPARGYIYGGALWTIVRLNDSLQGRFLNIWPRIDKIPNCPPELKQMVQRQVVGR